VQKEQLVELTTDIVAAHVTNNNVATSDVPGLVKTVYQALASLGVQEVDAPVSKTPVVSARASIKPDYLVCMECGKKQKALKRHLQTAHGLSPDQYRQDFVLSADYPMTAPAYSARRSALARSLGLGKQGRGRVQKKR
jgi:predicted transcriptional regulator